MSNDYYELLQVHPRADADAIAASYRRLSEQYDPARLQGAADELIEIARRKTAELADAYAVLSDPEQRAAYDAQLAQVPTPAEPTVPPSSGSTPIHMPDYRPLPPADHAERPRHFDNEPMVSVNDQLDEAPPRRAAPSIGLVLLLMLPVAALLIGVLMTGTPTPVNAPAAAVATPTATILEQIDALIVQARADAEANPTDPQRWREYANLLYDSVQIIRENAPDSDIYRQYVPRWLEAAEAYSKTLALDPQNVAVHADLGACYCFYGASTKELAYVERGLNEVRLAQAKEQENPRVLLSLGYCLVSQQPPQTDDAIAAWQRIVATNPADSPFVNQAQTLIERYRQ